MILDYVLVSDPILNLGLIVSVVIVLYWDVPHPVQDDF